jgi:signal transduction histidine kinase
VTSPDGITRTHLQRLLVLGLGLSTVLLLSAVLVAVRTVSQINENTQLFTNRQALAKESIDDIEKEQAQLNSAWLNLAHKSDLVGREEILKQINQSHLQMSQALDSAYDQAELLREIITEKGQGLVRWTVWLFAVCVGLSVGCASWAVRASATLFRRLEQQAAELTQLQYQFLETQENVARRFSHELHDELGQALTAVKANLSALRRTCSDDARVNDCMALVDGAIQDVREMSQLLRPTILDDFGLDAALRALAESFGQRTGIEVHYDSNFAGERLRDQTETHLFRIAQEALTNVARHSGGTDVWIELDKRGKDARLSIRDNGHGFKADEKDGDHGLGLTGMHTRARGCGGTLRLKDMSGKGVEIEVVCPITT